MGTMKDTTGANLDFALYMLLTQAAHVMVRVREKELKQWQLLVPQVQLLQLVHTLGAKSTPAEISRWMIRETHTVSGILDRMEKEGLVRRVADPNRKNGVKVVLTRKGEQARLKASSARDSISSIWSRLSEKERKQLESSLAK